MRQLTTTLFNKPTSQGGVISFHQARLLHRHLKAEKKDELWNVLSKKGECRSKSAKPAERSSLQEKTFPDPLQTKIYLTNTKL